AEVVPQLRAIRDVDRVDPRDVTRELVMPLGPFAYCRQLGTEGVRDDILRIADEHRPVAHPRESLDVLDHVRVVVRGSPDSRSSASGIGSMPTKSVIQAYANRLRSGFSCRKWSTSHASSSTTRS